MQEFVDACPALAAADRKSRDHRDDEPAPGTVRLGNPGRAYAHAIRDVPAHQREALADVLEPWMTSDCQNLRDLAGTGFIRTLAVTAHELRLVEEVAETLLPSSLAYYRSWLDPETVS